jgi:hypothetical protein
LLFIRGSLNTIARNRPSAKVVATERMANTNVQMSTARNGPRIDSVENARTKLSTPTQTCHPVARVCPSAEAKEPLPLSW